MNKPPKALRRLKALRQLKGLNQTQVAKILELSMHGYFNKENGRSQFTLEEAKKLSDLFGMSVDDIFFDTDVIKMITKQ